MLKPKAGSFVVLGLIIASAALAEPPSESALTPEAQEELNLRQDIQLLNLVNGMYLTREQMQELVKVIRVAERLNAEHQARMQEYSNAAQPVLQELRQSLITGQNTPEELEGRVHHVQGPIHKDLEEHQKKMMMLVDDVRQILNENQLELIRDYKPCLIVPYSPNSVGIGQSSGDPGPSVRILERARRLRAPIWSAHKDRMVERLAEHALFYGHVQITSEQKQQVLEMMEQARALSDVEWEGQKTVLAMQMQPVVMPEHKPQGDLQLARKVGQFMLNPRLVPILEARLAQAPVAAEAP